MKKRVALYIIFVLISIGLIVFYIVNTNNQKKVEQIKKKEEQSESKLYNMLEEDHNIIYDDNNIANDDSNITNDDSNTTNDDSNITEDDNNIIDGNNSNNSNTINANDSQTEQIPTNDNNVDNNTNDSQNQVPNVSDKEATETTPATQTPDSNDSTKSNKNQQSVQSIIDASDKWGSKDNETYNRKDPEISLSETQMNLFVGSTKIVEAKIKSNNTPNKEVTWTSSNKKVATVENAKIEGTYYIKTKVNDKVLSVEGNKTTNSAKIQVYKNQGLDSQKYELIDAGNDYYIIRVKGTGKVLDVQGNKAENSTKVIQYDLNGNTNQLWELEDAGNGYKYIRLRNTNLYLDIQGGKAKDGDKLIVYKGTKKDNQKFKLDKIGAGRTAQELAKINAKANGETLVVAKINGIESKPIKVTVKKSHWEIKNKKYIYHYLDGKTKEWTVSEYTAWKKLIDQNVKAKDPKAYTIKKRRIFYDGFSQYYVCKDETANNIAIKNGVSPYAITVDIDRNHESIFKNNNGVWEPYKNTWVRTGAKFKNYKSISGINKKLHPKNNLTPVGLFYTNGAHWPHAGANPVINYWVAFGVYGKDGHTDSDNVDYLHDSQYPRSVGTGGCVAAPTKIQRWIYYNCGRGTPVLIW